MSTSNLAAYIDERRLETVRLHLGCGGVRWKDFINVDLYRSEPHVSDTSRGGCVADVIADIRSLGLGDATIDEIFTSHTIDHFTRWEAVDMLKDWYRILKPRGLLVIEAADFWRCVLWLLHPKAEMRRLARTQFYGNQWDRLEYETHKYVWGARELKSALVALGFREVTYNHATLTHYPGRDMRVLARK